MADIAAHTRAQYTRMSGSNGRSRLEMERCRERRRRRMQMRRNTVMSSANAANTDIFPSEEFVLPLIEDISFTEDPQYQGTAVEGFPPPSGGFPWGPRNGGFATGESSQQGGGPSQQTGYSRMFENGGLVTGDSPDVGSSVGVGGLPIMVERADTNDVPIVGAVAVHTSLCSPDLNHGRPVHFFGVFDGHGGSHVAIMCQNKMHAILKDELMRAQYPIGLNWPSASRAMLLPTPPTDESALEEEWRKVFSRCFARTETVALHTCGCGSVGFRCTCTDRSAVLQSGSTAVTAVLTEEHIVVANCGDSRAVLCRGGRVVPLSSDHKPDREDERARIEACGGHVYFLDTARVEGVLAMSRAIGDRFLKPSVTSEPEVTFTRRAADDEFLILASDGLWDVMSNEMTCHVARECLIREPQRTVVAAEVGPGDLSNSENDRDREVFPSHSASAAALLTRLALARGTCDNVCVVVVDLKRAL